MSVKELKLTDSIGNEIKIKTGDGGFYLKLLKEGAYLTRSQAHLLMLYLQEHLK